MEIKKEDVGKYKYYFTYSFDYIKLEFCRYFKKKYGYTNFGFLGGKWRFNNLDFVDIIKKRFGEDSVIVDTDVILDMNKFYAEKQLDNVKKQNAEIIKNKLESSIKIVGLKNEPYGYQKVGVEFFDNNDGKAILADEPGSGKTLQALAYSVYTKKEKILVICPSSVKYSWETEIKKWTKLNSLIINSKTEITQEDYVNNDVFVLNYDILSKFLKKLSFFNFDLMVLDEFHYIKNRFSKRTKAALFLSKKIKSILLLSGTPMLNRPVELFPGLHIMDPKEWNDWYVFTARYCNGHKNNYGWDASGASNIDELKQKISKYFLRRTKDQILKFLPPKIFIDTPVDLDAENYLHYQEVEGETSEKYSREWNGSEMNALVALGKLRQISSSGKIYAAKEIVDNIIDNNEKIIVFSAYNEPLEKLKEKYGDSAVILTGKTSEKDRSIAIKKFQEDKNIKVFLGGIKSAGVGITLTAASNVLFIDYSWVPADHQQAIDRVHRPSQEASSINVYQLHARNTIDDYMKNIIDSKKQLVSDIIDSTNSNPLMINIASEVLRTMIKKNKN